MDYSKLKKVPKDSVEYKLYTIIDDIDTFFDVFKPKKEYFENAVLKKIKEAHNIIVSDGYNLYYK